jgi:hypothetical protein
MRKTNLLLIFFIVILLGIASKKSYSGMIDYQGKVYSIFFHPLIVYPDLAFNKKNDHLVYMDDWFVTKNEFNKIILELYKRGFVLISLKDIFEEKKDSQGQLIIKRKKLLFPEGKTPLLLSLDDYNFYNTMKTHGTIDHFYVDKKNNLVTVSSVNGKKIIGDDQEIPQLLEKFITAHPDFSYHHAKGIIGLTGYNGIFGYTTQKIQDKNYNAQLIEAKKVVQKLKNMRWEFASHSYFHLSESQQTESQFEQSEKRWKQEVGFIVGPTSYYIFPFGESWDENGRRMKFLKSMGYKYFFGVSQSNEISIQPDCVIIERFPMDGFAVRGKYSKSNFFITPSNILDHARIP